MLAIITCNITVVYVHVISMHAWSFLTASASNKPGFLSKLLRVVFGRSGSLMSKAIKTLLFISVTGFLVAVTIFYFNLSLDFDSMAVQSQIGEC